MQEFNVTMMDIGAHVLPGVNKMLRDFKGILEGLRAVLPGGNGGNGMATVLGRAGEGAIAGAGWGVFGGPLGVGGGALAGGLAGGVEGIAETYMRSVAATK